jgi:hypothetical protein
MEDLRLKRKLIELGHLQTWKRRGRSSFQQRKSLTIPLLQAILSLTGLHARGEENARSPLIKEIRFEFDTLPEAFYGFKILHLSDIHADGFPGLAESVYERIRDLEVDLCVLTGDYRFDTKGPCHNIYPQMEKILAGVQARHGIVGILGNHDWAEQVPELERLGIRMLVNEAFEVQNGHDSLWLIGLDDPHYYGCDDLPVALREVPDHAFKILLVHTPEVLADADHHGIHLYLCGHTHGGQICLPFLGPLVVKTNSPRRYTRGVWQYRNVKGYTCAGVGCSGVPVRFFCPPEIGLIELHCTRTIQ